MATVRDLKVDPATLDLVLDGADLALVSDLAAISQSVRTRLRFFLGEWFADEGVGVPWWQSILVKNPNVSAIRAAIRTEILGTKGVARIESLNVQFDPAARTLSVAFSARADTGELLVFEEPFSPTPEVT